LAAFSKDVSQAVSHRVPANDKSPDRWLFGQTKGSERRQEKRRSRTQVVEERSSYCTERTHALRIPTQFRTDLAILAGLALLPLVVIFVIPLQALRIILGLPYVCFMPGYALLTALFPGSDDIKDPERTALSFGLSITVLSFIGLLLNFTPLKLHLVSVTLSISLFILVCCVVAHQRRAKLPPGKCSGAVNIEFPSFRWQDFGLADKVLSVTLAILIMTAIGVLAYAVTRSKVGERFTEFYILDLDGLAENYPHEAVVGQPVTVTVGIANFEGLPVEYRLAAISEEYLVGKAGPIHLEPGEIYEGSVTFVPAVAGDDVKVMFLLYRDGVEGPYRSLRLWLEVVE
jgi:uncharacterized membrane protein